MNYFPVQEIETVMASRGKSLRFVEEEVAELSEIEYGDKRTFALLSVLFPGFDFSHHFHVDHIFPKSRFSKAKLRNLKFSEEKIDELIDKSNRLPNLQLLEGTINNEKRQKMPHEWYALQWPDPIARTNHLQAQAIDNLPERLEEFENFYNDRKTILKARIERVLNS